MDGGSGSRWLVCSGALEFAGVAAALSMAACAESVQWSGDSAQLRESLMFSAQDEKTNVLVASGLDGGDPVGTACALAGLHRGRTVLCVPGASEFERTCAQGGVTAAVEPQGLVRLLVALRTEQLRTTAAASSANQAGDEADQGRVDSDGPVSEGCPAVDARAVCPACGAPSQRGDSRPCQTPSNSSAFASSDAQEEHVGDALPQPQGASEGGRPRDAAVGPATCADDAPAPVGHMQPPSTAARQVRSQGGVPLQECGRDGGAFDLDAIKEPVVLTPVVRLSQEVECRVAGMDDPVPTICMASARGGVGKSALAVVAALVLAKRGLNVALIDLDFQFGTCLGYLGSGETDGLIDAGCVPKAVRVDARTLARCRVTPQRGLAAYEFCRMPEQAELLSGVADELVRAARAGADVAVVDLPAGVNETVAQVIELSDRCLFVADQGALSLESLSAQQSLCARLGIPRTKLVTVMNRCDPRHRDEGFLSRVGFETQAPQVVRVLDGGPEVTQMLSIGRAAELLGIQNKFAVSVEALMGQICTGLGIPEFAQGAAHAPVAEGAAAHAGKPFWRRGRDREQEVEACPF